MKQHLPALACIALILSTAPLRAEVKPPPAANAAVDKIYAPTDLAALREIKLRPVAEAK